MCFLATSKTSTQNTYVILRDILGLHVARLMWRRGWLFDYSQLRSLIPRSSRPPKGIYDSKHVVSNSGGEDRLHSAWLYNSTLCKLWV